MKKIIELSRNEIPYPPPTRIVEAARKGLTSLNRYPSTEDRDELRRMLSVYSNVSRESILVSPGSDLLIMQMFHLFSKEGKTVIIDPTLPVITRMAKCLAAKVLKVKISEPDFTLSIPPLIQEIKDASLVFIDNPNNPTGRLLLDRQSVNALSRSVNGVLLIDEAYYEFCNFSVADMVKDHVNLAVTRTMSKAFGLAGLRIGYMIAGKNIAGKFSDLTLPFPLSRSSIYATIEALRDTKYVKKNVKRVIEERERVRRQASQIGVRVYPSNTNFLLMSTNVPYTSRKLKKLGVTVSDLSGQLSPEFIRVSIGTKEENDAFLSSLREIIE